MTPSTDQVPSETLEEYLSGSLPCLTITESDKVIRELLQLRAQVAQAEPPQPLLCANCGKTMAEHDRLAQCAVAWGPEKQDTPGGPVYRVGASTGTSMPSQPLAQRETAGKWQPIETAPKLRKVLAGYFNKLGNWRTITARYYLPDTLESEHTESGFADEGWYEESDSIEEIMPTDCDPTHWMHLPSAPESKA